MQCGVGLQLLDGNPVPWRAAGAVLMMSMTVHYPEMMLYAVKIVHLSYAWCAAGGCTVSVHMEAITGSFTYRIPNGKRRESLKSMLFSFSISLLDDHHLHKGQPKKDMLVV